MGKKKKGGGGGAAPPGPVIASDDVLRAETLDEMETRHELELAEVKKTTAGMTSKKDAMQVLQIEGEVTDRHYLETQRWEELHESVGDEEVGEEEKKGDDAPLVASMASASLNDTSNNSKEEETKNPPVGMTKAMKRRLKKEQEERERDERIEREKGEAGPSDGEIELTRLRIVLEPRGLKVHDIKADGHCLYRAISDQLVRVVPGHSIHSSTSGSGYESLRTLAAHIMKADSDSYRPFVEDISSDDDWLKYLSDVESTAAWGGQLELQALAVALKTPIEVFCAGMPVVTMGEEFKSGNSKTLKVCHHRHAFGLGEHYNSAVDA